MYRQAYGIPAEHRVRHHRPYPLQRGLSERQGQISSIRVPYLWGLRLFDSIFGLGYRLL